MLTSQRSIRAGFKLGLNRAGFGPVWAELTRTRGVLWRSWALTGLRFLAVGMSAAHGGPKFTVHGPKAGSMVDRVHCHFPSARLMCTGCRAALLNSPLLLCFLHGALPPATCSPASSHNGSGVQLRWGKASLHHGDCNGEVRTADGAS